MLLDRHFEEHGTEALHLFFDRRSNVERRDDGAEASCGCNRLEARHAGAENEHARGWQGPRRGHQHREQATAGGGSQQHRLVTGHRGLRRQHVHRLRACDARQQHERERRELALRELPEQLGHRLEERDQNAAVAVRRKIGDRRRLYLHHDVGLTDDGRPVGDLHAGGCVSAIWKKRGHSRAALDDDFVAAFHEAAGDVRGEGDPPLVGGGLFRHTDAHMV